MVIQSLSENLSKPNQIQSILNFGDHNIIIILRFEFQVKDEDFIPGNIQLIPIISKCHPRTTKPLFQRGDYLSILDIKKLNCEVSVI